MDMNWISLSYCLILTSYCLGLNNETQIDGNNETQSDGKSSRQTEMDTLMKEALSNNTAVFELNISGGTSQSPIETGKRMRSLTISALGTPSDSWSQFLSSSDTKSVPVILGKMNHTTNKPIISTKKEQISNSGDKNQSRSGGLSEEKNQSVHGIHIPIEFFSRTRRQAPTQGRHRSRDPLPSRRRVLFLLNPNRTQSVINRTMLLRPSLLLIRNNDTLHPGHRILPNNQQRQVSQTRTPNRLSTVTRQPAIQTIDLRSIDLSQDTPLAPSTGSNNIPNNTSIVRSVIGRNISSVLTANDTGRNILSRLSQNLAPRRQHANGSRRTTAVPSQAANVGRTTRNRVANNNIRRPVIEPRLTLQHPVLSRRIAFVLRPNNTVRGNVRPVARTLLPQTRRRLAVTNRNRLTVRNTPRTRAIPVLQRTGTRRRGAGRPARTSQRTLRRVTRPVDPFTRRFSAGFQRGSNLLNQPDITETRGFDGTSRPREGAFRPNFRDPFGLPRGPGFNFFNGPGGFGMPGGMFGPPLL